MRIVYAGTPDIAVPHLEALLSAGHDIVGVLTREDAPQGRKRVLTPSPVASRAEQLGIPTHKANKPDDTTTQWVRALNPDIGVVVAYGALLKQPLLDATPHGWINLHFSELPRWRGAAPVQRALMAGEPSMHVAVFRLVEALDAGDVLSRASIEIAPGESADQVFHSLTPVGSQALVQALQLIANDPAAGEPQQGEATYAHKLTREDGKLDLARAAHEVLAHWAGVTPEPGAYVTHEGQTLKLHRMVPAEERKLAPGQVTLTDGHVLLGTGEGTLELIEVQPAGKPKMQASDWLRGRGGAGQVQ